MKSLSAQQVLILDTSIEAVLPHLDLRSLSGQRLFITGGTGFFGLWLLSALRVLRQHGIEVQTCVLSRNPSAFLERYPQFRDQSWLDFIVGNVRDFEIPAQKFDLLLHAAAETSISAHADPTKMFDDIVLGTQRILQLSRSNEVKRILLISSGAVYGPQAPHLTHQPDDSLTACDPWLTSSAYGEGKRVMELMGAMLQKNSAIECLAARCFSFSGPGIPLDAHFAIGNFIRDALSGNPIKVKGDGTQTRSYLYGADLAIWLLYLLTKGKSGSSYNVGSDEPLTIQELALTIRDLLAPNSEVTMMPAGERTNLTGSTYVPNIDRARSLNCKPWTSLSDSIILTAKYYSELAI